MSLVAATLLASAESKVELGEAVIIMGLGVIAFPGLILADVQALVLERKSKCDESHNVYVYVPVPKTGGLKKATFTHTCAEWVAE